MMGDLSIFRKAWKYLQKMKKGGETANEREKKRRRDAHPSSRTSVLRSREVDSQVVKVERPDGEDKKAESSESLVGEVKLLCMILTGNVEVEGGVSLAERKKGESCSPQKMGPLQERDSFAGVTEVAVNEESGERFVWPGVEDVGRGESEELRRHRRRVGIPSSWL